MNKNIEVEGGEIAIRNSHGDLAIIPKNKVNWVKQKLSEGCHDCIDSLVETLPVASQYAQDGSVYPPNTKVKVNENNQIKEYDISSPEYKNLYDSGKLMSYDKTSNTYIATPLEEVTVTAKAPQWLKYKRKYESQYTKDWYIDNNMPKFSRSMGVSADNMHPNNVKEYDSYINDKVVEDIFKSKPTFDEDYSNDRLKTLQGFSQKELELIKNSKYASKIEPSIWSKFEQGLLSIGNAGSPVTFKNENLTKEEAKQEDNPLNILQPLSVPSKMVQSVYKKDYSLKDALKGKQNNAGIVEDIVTDPLNLVGVGLAGTLSKADKVIDATKAGSKVLNKLDDAVNNINRIKFDDFKNDNEFFRIIVGDEAFDDIIKTGQIRVQRPSSYKTEPGVINLDRRGTTPSPSFSKGKPSIEYAKGNPEHYIIRTSEPLKPSTMGAHGKGSTMFPTDEAGKHLKSLDASKTQVYKHIGNGEYELVDVTKAGSKVLNKTDDVLSKIGTPLNRSIDIHDIRKKYHNDLILQPDEIKLLQREGKGNRTNYRNVSGTDIAGKIHQDDIKPKEINFDRNSIEELLFGKDYGAEKVPTKSNVNTLNDIKLNNSNKSIFEENKLNIKSYKDEIEDLIKDFKTDISVFERTETSMKADKWLNDWFTHPETKKAFINYGGTEKEWVDILNTLENPIRSSVKYGKGQPGGVYMDVFKQASIPINAKVDVGVHEGIHKTGLLLKKSNPILNELWNDFTDAVREIPTESYPEIFRLRYNMGLKPGQKIDMETLDKGLKTIQNGYSIPNKIKDKNKLLDIINKAPALVPFLGTYLQSQNQNKNEQ